MELLSYLQKKSWILILISFISFGIGEIVDRLNLSGLNSKKISRIDYIYEFDNLKLNFLLEESLNNVSDKRISQIHKENSNIFNLESYTKILRDYEALLANAILENENIRVLASYDELNFYESSDQSIVTFAFLHTDSDENSIVETVNNILDRHHYSSLEILKQKIYENLKLQYKLLKNNLEMKSIINNEIIYNQVEFKIEELDNKINYLKSLKNSETNIGTNDLDLLKSQDINEENMFLYEISYPSLFLKKYAHEIEIYRQIISEIDLINKAELAYEIYLKNYEVLIDLKNSNFTSLLEDLKVSKSLEEISEFNVNQLDFIEDVIVRKTDRELSIEYFWKLDFGIIIALVGFILTLTVLSFNFYRKKIN